MSVEQTQRPIVVRGTEIRPGDDRQRHREKIARVTLDSMVQFVGLLDANGTVLEINKVALDAVGIELADVEGRPFWETFWWQVSAEVNATLRGMIARAARGEFVRWDAEIFGRAGGKETIIIDASLMPVRDDEGEVVFICAEGRDITEKKAQEREIARQREELAKLDELKTLFFANVSHEFRTPLTLMMGPLEDAMASPDGLSGANRERLELTHRNSLRLLKLVNTLLDFSRIEAGRIQASYEPIDLPALTAELASVFRSAVERAGLRLLVDCPPLPEPVYVDREMWEKIVLNLLSNAFKFTFEGEIAVSLRPADLGVRLTVRDTGTGIPPDEVPRLFERFHRVKGARGRSYEGSGIGLALVQELARLHGGTVSVESEEGRGSAFAVTVPPGKAHLPPDRVGAERTLSSTGVRAEAFIQEALRWLPDVRPGERIPDLPVEGLGSRGNGHAARGRILLADDNADMREYVRRLLGGYEVEAVPDGLAALRAARERRPDLVLTDVMMPGVDGFGLLHELRADPHFRDVPVILLSARAGEEARIEGIGAGADDYLTKPFSGRELLARVQAHLQLAQSRRESREVLRASEERYRVLVTATSDVVYRMSADWEVMYPLDGRNLVASNATPIHGWMDRNLPRAEHARVRDAIGRAVSRKQTFELEHQVVRVDGTLGWTLSRAAPILDAAGDIVEWFGTARDITEQKRAEAELRDIRSRMDAALEAGAIGTWAWDVQADRFHGDASLARIFSVPPEAVAGGPISRIMGSIHPDDRERVGELVARAVESGDRYEADYRVDRGDGSWRWVTARGQVERDAEGRAVRFPGVVVDISDRKRAEEALARVTEESERRKRLYETALSNTPDLVYVFGLDHRFHYANEALLKMWGRTWDEAIGKTCLELGYEPWHASKHDEEIEQVVATKQPIRGEVPFTGTDGRKIYDYIFVPVFGTDGEVEAVAGTTRDITERQAMEQELREADRKKDDFIALLAHELKNPLAPIRNGLQVIRLAAGNPAALAEAREMMELQLSHMVRLIDDLLDVSRINRNKMELRRTRVSLADVVSSAVETARPAIEEAGHELTVSLPSAPIHLDADLTRLSQVFSNLLTNSAKYTEPGGPVWISAERRGSEVSVSVRDTGIGIPPESLGSIFDMFSQVDRTIERSTGGLGIGLALVKGLTEMHGGTVTVASEGQGKGSTFTVTLPVLAVQAEPAKGPAANPGTSGPKRRILVVDDSKDSARSMAMMLKLMGNEVRAAHDGLEAVEQAEAFRPEVILMDVGMPKLNGYEATRRIREQPWGNAVTIIALTGWGQEDDRVQSKEAGCDSHLVKPVNLSDLEKLLGEMRG